MKKFLSLVLALVMTMSLVTVSAGAKDFSDDGSITYQEAVDVISEIGVVDGYTGGDFKPTDVLTRGAAAKIICNLILGPTTASALSASTAPFKDVPVSNVFAGYITYCSQRGIINGYSDGTFRPGATLTGNAFMKMLLGALGYDSSIEGYTGPNWTVNVIKQAAGIGLDDGNDEFVGSKAVTREEAALYAFNMLQATMVEYDAKTTVDVNGATITIAGDKAQDKSWGTATNNDGNIKDDGFVQFAEQNFDKLVLKADTVDDFGRPANTWRFKGVEVGTFPKTADATYTADVKIGQIYSDLGMSDKDEKAEVYVDGVKADELAKVSKGNDLKVSELKFDGSVTCDVGNGTKIEAFLNEDTNDVTIVAINTYVAEVNKVVAETNSKEAYITLSAPTSTSPVPTKWNANDEFETTGFENDQIVLFTYSNSAEEIKSVKAAESAEGTLTKKVAGKSIDLGETTYKYSNEYGVDGGEDAGLSVNSEYIAYLDEYGYAIYVEETEYNIADYAYLRALDSASGAAFGSDRASLLTYDAKVRTVDTNKDYSDVAGFSGYKGTQLGKVLAIGSGDSQIVVAKEASNGDYRLKTVKTVNFTDTADKFTMDNGKAKINLASTSDYIYADSKTVVVVGTYNEGADTGETVDKANYRAYTGVNNMPTIEKKAGSLGDDLKMSYYCRSGNVATIIFLTVDEDQYDVTAGNNDVIFFSVESGSKLTEDADNSYYTYTAVVNGKIVEGVKVADDVDIDSFANNGKFDYASAIAGTGAVVFTGADYDDGVITGLDVIKQDGNSGYGTTVGVDKLSSGNLVLGGGKLVNGTTLPKSTYVVANDVKVFFLNDDGEITEGAINNVRRSDKDIVTYVLDDGQISYLFVQQYFENNDQEGVIEGPTAGVSLSASGNASYIAATAAAADTTYTFELSTLTAGGYQMVYTGSATMAAGSRTVSMDLGNFMLSDNYYQLVVKDSASTPMGTAYVVAR